jgi:hypothetical protein
MRCTMRHLNDYAISSPDRMQPNPHVGEQLPESSYRNTPAASAIHRSEPTRYRHQPSPLRMKRRRSLYARPEIVRGEQCTGGAQSQVVKSSGTLAPVFVPRRSRRVLARDLPETALHVTSHRLTTRSLAAPFTCSVAWVGEVVHGYVNQPSINGNDGVAGPNSGPGGLDKSMTRSNRQVREPEPAGLGIRGHDQCSAAGPAAAEAAGLLPRDDRRRAGRAAGGR